jgi:murein L,D-transpeptidase YafK
MPGSLSLAVVATLAMPVPGWAVGNGDLTLERKGLPSGSPVFIRIFKQESEFELWMQKDGRFELFATYPVCFWSGRLGPKLREGDRQAPEGLYSIGLSQTHHRGRLPRSLDIGFPNSFDRANARTGSYILLHGGCKSTGCFAMTDAVMDEIYSLSEQALRLGQDRFQVHVFPFRMTEANLAVHANSEWHGFWLNLKEAYDIFERTRIPPKVGICGKRYVVDEGVLGARDKELPVVAAPDTPSILCEDTDVSPIPIPVLSAQTEVGDSKIGKRRIATQSHSRRTARRNTRKAHAVVGRSRMADQARRTRSTATAVIGSQAAASDGAARLHRALLWR